MAVLVIVGETTGTTYEEHIITYGRLEHMCDISASWFSRHPPPSYYKRQTVALGVVVSEVRYFAVLDVQPCLSLVLISPAIARFTGVGDNLGDGADVRPATRITCLVAGNRGVPPENLIGVRKGMGGGRGEDVEGTCFSISCSRRTTDPLVLCTMPEWGRIGYYCTID